MNGKVKVQARKLKGFQDYHPQIQKNRLHIMDLIRKHAGQAGFQTIATPALEYSEVLLGVGGETDKQVFRFKDNGDRDVSLRFDLTVPFARYVAENQGKINLPFKRLQIGDVWRAEKPQKGRYREFCQCDLDIVGVNSDEADIEILLCFQKILSEIDCGPFTMHVGHRSVLSAMIRHTLGSLSPDQETQVLIALDKMDKVGQEKVNELLSDIDGVNANKCSLLTQALSDKTDQGTNLEKVRELLSGDTEATKELDNLVSLVDLISSLCANGQGSIRVDLSIARGLGYYTGLVFETTLDSLPGWGAICSGGRYNYLVQRYLNQEIPGIGGSLGLDRLIAALQEMDKLLPSSHENTVFVAMSSSGLREHGFSLAHKLRSAGISTDIALKVNKLGAQFKHANRMGYPVVLILGEDEIAQNSFSVKNMATGDEEKCLPIESCVSYLKDRFKNVLLKE